MNCLGGVSEKIMFFLKFMRLEIIWNDKEVMNLLVVVDCDDCRSCSFFY